jgi:TFIIF-interacting CTD phosphatase-like protein
MYMYLRPGLLDFLEAASEIFELILCNTCSEVYTRSVLEKLLDLLFIQKASNNTKIDHIHEADIRKYHGIERKVYFDHVICREQCSTNEKAHEIKNLEFFTDGESNRYIRDCIIVDNQVYCYQNQITNGLFVPNYNFSDTHDDWLPLLQKYLVERFGPNSVGKQSEDVRGVLCEDLRFEEILNISRAS